MRMLMNVYQQPCWTEQVLPVYGRGKTVEETVLVNGGQHEGKDPY